MMDKTTQVIDVLSMGYGTVPTSVMSDRKLTVEAKAIYAYFAACIGGRGHQLPHGGRNLQGSQYVQGPIPEASEKLD